MDQRTMWMVGLGGGAVVLALLMRGGSSSGGVRSLAPLPADPSVTADINGRWNFAGRAFDALANVQRAAYDSAARLGIAETQAQAQMYRDKALAEVARQEQWTRRDIAMRQAEASGKGKSGFRLGIPGLFDIGFNY